MAERIRVSGFRPPVLRPDRRNRVPAVALIRPASLIGPLGAAGILIAVFAWGTPHMLLYTRSSGYGSAWSYDDCAYGALDGRVLHVHGASCPLFRLLHEGR